MSNFQKNILLGFILTSILLSSCFKEKAIKGINTNPIGDISVANMGEHYDTQLYYNLQTKNFVSTNTRYEYDLAFDSKDGKYLVWLNGANLMLCAQTNKFNLADVVPSDTLLATFKVELGQGREDSNAIGKWYDSNLNSLHKVYILNMGLNQKDANRGYKKIQFNNYENGYSITFANLDGSDQHTSMVTKVANKNKVFLSFNNGGMVKDLEPENTNWDLIFTDYSVYFQTEKLPYKVTGILTNPTRTFAYFMDSTSNFDSIKYSHINNSEFNTDLDNIGYLWKHWSGGINYLPKINFNYIIKTDSRYFKLRMLDFSNSNGVKGHPKFQFKELTP